MFHTLVDVVILACAWYYGTLCGQDYAAKTGWYYNLTNKTPKP